MEMFSPFLIVIDFKIILYSYSPGFTQWFWS